jgi:hypothetical protein
MTISAPLPRERTNPLHLVQPQYFAGERLFIRSSTLSRFRERAEVRVSHFAARSNAR